MGKKLIIWGLSLISQKVIYNRYLNWLSTGGYDYEKSLKRRAFLGYRGNRKERFIQSVGDHYWDYIRLRNVAQMNMIIVAIEK